MHLNDDGSFALPTNDSTHAPEAVGMKFRKEGEPEMLVHVIDKFPALTGVHIEGRHVIEVSVEWFMAQVAKEGWFVVDPRTDETVEYKEETL